VSRRGGAGRPRLEALPGRELPGGLRVVDARGRAARLEGLARLDALPPPAVFGGWKYELTVLLAEMTVHHLRPALS